MSRIYSFHWLQSDLFIICASEGRLQMWRLQNNCVTCIGEFNLPPGRERWSTASCLCGTENFGVGDRNGNLYLYSFKNENCIQVIKKAHNYMGVTHLSFSESMLISLGTYFFFVKIKINLLNFTGRDSTVKRYHFDPTSEVLCPISSDKLPFSWLASRLQNLVIGFSGKAFVVYDYETRKALLDIDCSGGHRLWDFIRNDKSVLFAYTKDKSINLNICNWLNLSPTNVIASFHFGEINAAVCIGNYLISGGEDTMLRISRFATTDLENVAVLKSHLSSIRAITYFKLDQTEKYVVFSAGGRSQVISWEFDGVCTQKCSYYEPQEVETRIMDLCIVPSIKDTLLLAACSNGSIKVFDTYNNLRLLGQFIYKRKCIIRITYLQIAGCDLVITAATDGKIVFWNFNIELLSELKPFFEINSHQSGINCLYHKTVSLNQCLFLTGGDDNKINLYLLEITSDHIKIMSSFCDTTSHCAQITGAFVGNKYFLTTSIDQRLTVFEWQLCAGKLCCQFIKRFNIDIPDVHGMCCQEDKDGIKVIVYGKGVQICKIKYVLA